MVTEATNYCPILLSVHGAAAGPASKFGGGKGGQEQFLEGKKVKICMRSVQ